MGVRENCRGFWRLPLESDQSTNHNENGVVPGVRGPVHPAMLARGARMPAAVCAFEICESSWRWGVRGTPRVPGKKNAWEERH